VGNVLRVKMKRGKKFKLIKIVSVLAILLSLFLIYEHYDPTPSQFCTFGESFDCNVVNKSPYSNIDGVFYFLGFNLGLPVPLLNIPIPVAAVSVLVFLYVFLSAGAIEKKKNLVGIKPARQLKILKWLMALSILFALYLFYIEKFILLMYCIFCIALDVLIFINAMLIYGVKK
tara:strand:+ start:1471 stop:1989 length:519 start_codon:yes stop_codon:yes gene_type:complete